MVDSYVSALTHKDVELPVLCAVALNYPSSLLLTFRTVNRTNKVRMFQFFFPIL